MNWEDSRQQNWNRIKEGHPMAKEEKVTFLKNPNDILEKLIKDFVRGSAENRRTPLDHGVYWDEPLVGFASGNDPLFAEYKTIIGPFHLTPREIIAEALRGKGKPLLFSDLDQVSVVSWVLPMAEDIRKSNRKEDRFPSKLWTYAKDFGEACNSGLRRHVSGFLEDLGHVAVAPLLLPSFRLFRDEKTGWASIWSERHAAFACGLGTFGLSDGFITPRGIAMRVGSVVTLLKLTPSEKKHRYHQENCLFFRNEKCGRCIARCPAGAITEKGHDKDKCHAYLNSEPLNARRSEYGLQGPGSACGLCQTGVPCEFQIPRPDLIA